MSGQQGVEKTRVEEEVRRYFKGKDCTFKGLGRYDKKSLSRGTAVYVIEAKVEEWPAQHYAMVLVSRARVQGVIVLDAEEIQTVVGMLNDGLREEF